MALDLFAVLFGGAPALLPVFASAILKVGPQGFGLLRTARRPARCSWACGWPTTRPGAGPGWCCWAAWPGSACAGSPSPFPTWFWPSLLLLALSGALDNVSVVLRNTLLQTRTPPEMMGRVQAVGGFFISSSNELGAFESGLAAKLLGVVPSVVFGGLHDPGRGGGHRLEGPGVEEAGEDHPVTSGIKT